ncbi:hypothetical protein ElyMa_000751500 [Elysia marginata]|uniref:Uncharacterized protein n=1 Tax=Elysia marginata TaxID=1093978 RepID=A0AAV4GQH7_9GAST|nr:hypothetical protein ElyMa_000751500 [Elysia marginata]
MNEKNKERVIQGMSGTSGGSEAYHCQDSKTFLKCLLLQPVQVLDSKEECRTDPNQNRKSTIYDVDTEEGTSKTKALETEKAAVENQIDNSCVGDSFQQSSDSSNSVQRESTDKNYLGCECESDKNPKRLTSLAEESLPKNCGKQDYKKTFVFCDENYLKKDKYIFRDGNTKPVLHFNETEETFPQECLDNIIENGVGHKRRLDRLIKSLKDREQNLENKLKEAQFTEDSVCRLELNSFTQGLRENLRVREKKKYESLINFERGKWQAHNKAFQELLPEKMEQINTNVKKQFETLKPPRRQDTRSKATKEEAFTKCSKRNKNHVSKAKKDGIKANFKPRQKKSSVKAKKEDKCKSKDFQIDKLVSALKDGKHCLKGSLEEQSLQDKNYAAESSIVVKKSKRNVKESGKQKSKPWINCEHDKLPANKDAFQELLPHKMKHISNTNLANPLEELKLRKTQYNKGSRNAKENKSPKDVTKEQKIIPKSKKSITKTYRTYRSRKSNKTETENKSMFNKFSTETVATSRDYKSRKSNKTETENKSMFNNFSTETVATSSANPTVEQIYKERENAQSASNSESVMCKQKKKKPGRKAKLKNVKEDERIV